MLHTALDWVGALPESMSGGNSGSNSGSCGTLNLTVIVITRDMLGIRLIIRLDPFTI